MRSLFAGSRCLRAFLCCCQTLLWRVDFCAGACCSALPLRTPCLSTSISQAGWFPLWIALTPLDDGVFSSVQAASIQISIVGSALYSTAPFFGRNMSWNGRRVCQLPVRMSPATLVLRYRGMSSKTNASTAEKRCTTPSEQWQRMPVRCPALRIRVCLQWFSNLSSVFNAITLWTMGIVVPHTILVRLLLHWRLHCVVISIHKTHICIYIWGSMTLLTQTNSSLNMLFISGPLSQQPNS